jgi:hypothetical protein
MLRLGLLFSALMFVSGCANCGGDRLMKPIETVPPGEDGGTCIPVAEACNGRDDDCDGTIDEDQPVATCGVGACERQMSTCVGGQFVSCVPGAPTAEVCNGLDDDCNGATDENLLPQLCGVGECAAMQPTCANGQPMACMPPMGTAEVCDGKDNNCDGTVDEGLVENTSGDLRITNNFASSDFVYIGKSDTGFGVVWQDKRDGANGQIYFAGLTSQGVRVTPGDLRVSNTNGSSGHPAIAWSGNSWGLVYSDDTSGDQELYYRPLNGNGSPTGTAIRLTNSNGLTDWPDLVWTGQNYAVAYEDGRAGANKQDLYFQRFDRNGTRIGGELQITTDPARQSSPILKWNGQEFGLTWTDYRNANNREIYFRRLAPDGTPRGGEVRITNDPADSAWPDMAWNDVAGEWAIVWHDQRDGNAEVYFTRLDATGNKRGGDVRLTNANGFSGYASIDWNGFQYGISWQDDRTAANLPSIYFAQVSSLGVKNGNELKLSTGTGVSSFTTALWNGQTFAFCWRDDRNGASNTEIYFALVGCPR